MSLYERVCAIAKEKGLAISKIERECGLSNATIRRWATQNPSLDSVQKVAHYLNVSINYLSGDTDEYDSAHNSTHYSQMETDIIDMLRLLDERDCGLVFDFVTMLYEKATGKKGSVYSTYTADELRPTSGPGANDEGQSGIA